MKYVGPQTKPYIKHLFAKECLKDATGTHCIWHRNKEMQLWTDLLKGVKTMRITFHMTGCFIICKTMADLKEPKILS